MAKRTQGSASSGRYLCRRGVPVLRRSSGGAADRRRAGLPDVRAGAQPRSSGGLRDRRRHRFVLGTLARALEPSGAGRASPGHERPGPGRLKFSGNSVRAQARSSLSITARCCTTSPWSWLERCLAMPPRQPAYSQPARARRVCRQLADCRRPVAPPPDRRLGGPRPLPRLAPRADRPFGDRSLQSSRMEHARSQVAWPSESCRV